MVPANCHPDRKHFAKGRCRPCYDKARVYTKDQQRQRNATPAAIARKTKWVEQKRQLNPQFFSQAHILRRYGLSADVLWTMLDEQFGKCKICLRDLANARYHVDHDHATGKVRGILCRTCNTSIGMLRESELNFRRAMAYLKSHNSLTEISSKERIQGDIRFVDLSESQTAQGET